MDWVSLQRASLASLWTSLVRGAVSRIPKFSARTLDRQIHLNVVPGSALGRSENLEGWE